MRYRLLRPTRSVIDERSEFSVQAPGEDRQGSSIGIVSWVRNELVIEGQRQCLGDRLGGASKCSGQLTSS